MFHFFTAGKESKINFVNLMKAIFVVLRNIL